MIVIVMGVSGSGKTTVGSLLAQSLGWQFRDADEFHPSANIEKMSRGIPLTDNDRAPWLEEMGRSIQEWLREDKNVVLACSALKASYRDILRSDSERVPFVYLKGSFELIQSRLAHRQNHFMRQELLRSQFDALEEPADDLQVDVSQSPEEIVQEIRHALDLPLA